MKTAFCVVVQLSDQAVQDYDRRTPLYVLASSPAEHGCAPRHSLVVSLR